MAVNNMGDKAAREQQQSVLSVQRLHSSQVAHWNVGQNSNENQENYYCETCEKEVSRTSAWVCIMYIFLNKTKQIQYL